jgi:hypothetical protein
VGIYGIEGSKPGAAAASIYLSRKVIRPTQAGYAVKDGPVSELFLEGKIEGGKLEPTSDVKRRPVDIRPGMR